MHALFTDITQILFLDIIPVWQALFLIGISFFTSAFSASMGIGGGVILMGIMASIVPIQVLIAAHGCVQLGSNAGRTYLLKDHVDYSVVKKFAIGGAVGAILGGLFFVSLSEGFLQAGLGAFLLYLVWGPKLKFEAAQKWGPIGVGGVGAFLSMFFGAVGPLLNSFLQNMGYTRQKLVGTQSACLVLQHSLKVIIFVILGVALKEWLPLIGLMIVTGFAGTWCGTHVLHKLPEALFQNILKAILTVISLNLLRQAFT